MRHDASAELAVRIAAEQTGRLDVAINNAGYALVGLAEAITAGQPEQECIAPVSSSANEEIRDDDASRNDEVVTGERLPVNGQV